VNTSTYIIVVNAGFFIFAFIFTFTIYYFAGTRCTSTVVIVVKFSIALIPWCTDNCLVQYAPYRVGMNERMKTRPLPLGVHFCTYASDCFRNSHHKLVMRGRPGRSGKRTPVVYDMWFLK